MYDSIDQLSVNAIRALSIDQIEKANSGHPGLPMGAAPMLYVLWAKHMKINPKSPTWVDRDRFVLSAGHGSAALYAMLHLSGYDLPMEEMKQFRQFGSKTPGHPELGYTVGVEVTTGPLGQGIANAVGMAMAEAHLAGTYNDDEHKIVDHYTYALCGDGCLMEGVASEAASMAGHMKLDKLIVLYDSNDISLDGDLNKSFSEDVQKRFESYGWNVLRVEDGNDLEAIDKAIQEAKSQKDAPTLIEIKTVIGYGSVNQGTNKVHGAPLGAEDAAFTKKNYGWTYAPFEIPAEVYGRFEETLQKRGAEEEGAWNERMASWKSAKPELAAQFEAAFAKADLDLDEAMPVYSPEDKAKASRIYSEEAIQALAKAIPYFWGGSADLSSSNKTMIKGEKDFEPATREGRNIWFGVREFAMAAAMNGILAHGGTIGYVSTFFVFSDYMKPAIRLSALSHIPTIYVFTHDSIAVGEDGPTHEPIEQLAGLRTIPNTQVFRPADGNETAQAWKLSAQSKSTPSVLALTRQNLPNLEGTKELAGEGVAKGAYVLSKQGGDKPEGILIATGSEVQLAVEAQKILAEKGHDVSVVSMPCMERFDAQDAGYKESVLPAEVTKRVSIEMGSTYGWKKYTGLKGAEIGIDTFGASGPADQVMQHFGFTVQNVVETYLNI